MVIWSPSEIKLVLILDVSRQAGVIVVTFQEFELVALKLRDDVLSGKMVPKMTMKSQR
jgi:hypothetical protein